MNRPAIHQLVAGFAAGDAISHEALAMRDLCRDAGHPAEVYAPADRIAADAAGECRGLAELAAGAGDALICHYSIASPAVEAFLSSPAHRVLLYHNITPAEFYAPYDAAIAAQLRAARDGLAATARAAQAVWADSAFNAAELQALGIPRVTVFPLVFSMRRFDVPSDPAVRARFAVPMTNILFVGRIAPNKCVEDLIEAFACFSGRIEPRSRLLIVGSDRSAPAYFAMLRMLAGELDLPNVHFERCASPAGLAAYYEVAHLFVTASRHEGYCLPLIEAMVKGVPVVARNTGGVPEAMGRAGVRYDDLRPEELAELWARVLRDEPLRQQILDSQRARVQAVLQRPVREELLRLLAQVIRSDASG